MKTIIPLVMLTVLLSCQKETEREATYDVTTSPLYREVMDIHDEGMALMDSLYTTKRSLQARLELPGLSDDNREDVNLKLLQLDSADKGMRVWMREFNPPVDSASAHAYLQEELASVKKVRADIRRALATAQ